MEKKSTKQIIKQETNERWKKTCYFDGQENVQMYKKMKCFPVKHIIHFPDKKRMQFQTKNTKITRNAKKNKKKNMLALDDDHHDNNNDHNHDGIH